MRRKEWAMKILNRVGSPSDVKKLDRAQLDELAAEIREEIVSVVLSNGGHLSSNLGVVEIVIAMHRVFDCPKDKFIFDVGHQCYSHKLLTGRRDAFSSLRKSGGISGFPQREESVYDCADTGHASTSISLLCGIARACPESKVVALIGDGALTGGLAYEGLNDLVRLGSNAIVIVNDNGMSISRNVGLVPGVLNGLKADVESAKSSLGALGLDYIRVRNGHDIDALCAALESAKHSTRPCIVHVDTVKGKGYAPAEEDSERYHGYSKSQSGVAFSDAFGEKLCELAAKDRDVYAVTAAMKGGTGLAPFAEKFPQRFFDVGIAEAHAVCMSSGLALGGKKPYVAIYSTFLQRAYDQVVHDVCINDLPVTFCVDRAGVVSGDGPTHQGVYDISFLRELPNIAIVCPKDIDELNSALEWSLTFGHPLEIRYPKGGPCAEYGHHTPMSLGKWDFDPDELLIADKVVLACGAQCCAEAKTAVDILNRTGIKAAFVNARFAKPLDTELLDLIDDREVVTVEDGVIDGGFGEAVRNYYAGRDSDIFPKVKVLGYDDGLYPMGEVAEIQRHCKTDALAILRALER